MAIFLASPILIKDDIVGIDLFNAPATVVLFFYNAHTLIWVLVAKINNWKVVRSRSTSRSYFGRDEIKRLRVKFLSLTIRHTE